MWSHMVREYGTPPKLLSAVFEVEKSMNEINACVRIDMCAPIWSRMYVYNVTICHRLNTALIRLSPRTFVLLLGDYRAFEGG
jgi:hypothetical protein